nr:DUF1134 domain-containing protein [Caulobacter sp. S45]
MNRRDVLLASLGAGAGAAVVSRAAWAQEAMSPVTAGTHPYSPGAKAEPYSQTEIVRRASNFFGVAAQTLAGVIEKAFKDNGLPTGYIAGTEIAGAVVVGLRYGKGELYMKHRAPERVFWQGPSAGFDFGGNGSRVFTLCYNLQDEEQIYRRFPGVEGSIYFVAGFGLNYQRADAVTLAPIRTGVGARAGASLGYLDYSRTRHISPL